MRLENKNRTEHNPNWPQIPNHPYKILINGGSGSGKANSLFILISHQPDIDKIYLYAKDPYETKYQLIINKRENMSIIFYKNIKYLNDSKAFIEYSNDIDDIYKSIEEYNPKEKCKILIVFDDMIADMLSNEKRNPTVDEIFIRGRKLKISLVFITQSYFTIPKNTRLNSAHYFIMKIPNKQELQQISFNHSSVIDFRDFTNFYKKCTS